MKFLLTTLIVLVSLIGCAREPQVAGTEPSMRRLTEQQYRNVIEDLFGAHIVVAGTFYPILRKDGLIAIGASDATVSALSFEKYEKLAHSIAEQIVNERNRSLYIACQPAEPNAADDACAQEFLEPVGRLLFRRPLSAVELTQTVDLSAQAAETLGGFYDGLAFGLASLLVSPNFLFIVDEIEAADGATDASEVELTAYTKASRLSFFLWNTGPDSELLDAAEKGDLDTGQGLDAQITRMMSSSRLGDGVRGFFSDMLRLEEFEHLEKDNLIYPAFDPEVREDTKEQLLRTIEYQLLGQGGDYRELYSTRKTFINGRLGPIYRTPVAEPDIWTEYELSDQEGRAGIQALAGFVALHSHPGRSSPTIRGKAVREILLCQTIPDPPGDVDFSLFVSTAEKQNARGRLKIHNEAAACAGCHKLMDGIGLSLENFDGAGQFRTMDAGMEIDVGGELDGTAYQDLEGFTRALAENPAVPVCLVEDLFAYSLGRSGRREDKAWLSFLIERFEKDGYRLQPLMRSIAASPNFIAVVGAADGESGETQMGRLTLTKEAGP
jgi:hypothetical protein